MSEHHTEVYGPSPDTIYLAAEPESQAGRELLAFLASIANFGEDWPVLSRGSLERIMPRIRMVEQQARADLAKRIEERVGLVRHIMTDGYMTKEDGWLIPEKDVLAIVRDELTAGRVPEDAASRS